MNNMTAADKLCAAYLKGYVEANGVLDVFDQLYAYCKGLEYVLMNNGEVILEGLDVEFKKALKVSKGKKKIASKKKEGG